MTSYQDILDAADFPDYDSSIRRIKQLAATTLGEADPAAKVFSTEHFNHSYLPDFVMRWDGDREDRFVFLRASSYAEEIEEDVRILADRHPMLIQLSQFRQYDETPIRAAIESLDRSAGAAQALVASIPAISHFEEAPSTGRMLSSFVMRGGKGLVEDGEAQSIAERVESGFAGALASDRDRTASAITAVEKLLDPRSTAEFSHLFEAAWISSGASAMEFPGAVTSIGEALSADLLRQLLDLVPGSVPEFWEKVGSSVRLESFENLHLVGDQPRLQRILKTALNRLNSNKCSIRRTQRFDQKHDPFIWQVDQGILSLRGGGYQAWVGPIPISDARNEEYTVESSPTLSKLSTRSEIAGLTLSEIKVRDTDEIVVTFSSPDDRDVATSDLVERVTHSLGTSVHVNEVVARVENKSVPIDFTKGVASPRTSSKVSVRGLIWSGWNLLAETNLVVRSELEQTLGVGDEAGQADPRSESDTADEAD